jgi:hypothetical protein
MEMQGCKENLPTHQGNWSQCCNYNHEETTFRNELKTHKFHTPTTDYTNKYSNQIQNQDEFP